MELIIRSIRLLDPGIEAAGARTVMETVTDRETETWLAEAGTGTGARGRTEEEEEGE